jgi:hypothetical protein
MLKLKDTLRKRFILAESDSLTMETIQALSRTHRQRLRVLRLKGTWRANSQNELCFDVALRKGPPQTYTFKGGWRLNKNQQIEYVCGEGPDVLTFKGYWDIFSANRLVYILEGSSTSRFEFKVQLESPTLYPKEGQIRYRIGIGARKSRLTGSGQIIILYGEWKFSRNLGLVFNMDYGRDGLRSIEFGADVTFQENTVAFLIRNRQGKSLGITLTFTHRLLKRIDAEAFLRLKALREEQGIEAGLKIPF